MQFLRTLFNRMSRYLRQKKWERLAEVLLSDSRLTISDVGVWCRFPEPHPAENWLEKQDFTRGNLIAVGLENMEDFKLKYPDVFCVQANGCSLPFKDGAVDYVVANAVLEHVPSTEQENFVAAMARVARKQAILTVPDRFCPIEIHSRIPLLHWLPFWRSTFHMVGEQFWSKLENLSSIFSKSTLNRLLNRSIDHRWMIKRQMLLFIPISLIAWITKPGVTKRYMIQE